MPGGVSIQNQLYLTLKSLVCHLQILRDIWVLIESGKEEGLFVQLLPAHLRAWLSGGFLWFDVGPHTFELMEPLAPQHVGLESAESRCLQGGSRGREWEGWDVPLGLPTCSPGLSPAHFRCVFDEETQHAGLHGKGRKW